VKLSAVKKRYRKIFLCGPAGNGKTVGGASFPGSTYWFEFDPEGLESVQTFYGSKGQDASRIEAIEFDSYIDHNPDKPVAYKAFEKKVTDWQAYVVKNGRMPFDNIVLDSLTSVQVALGHYIKFNTASQNRVFGGVSNLQDYLILNHFLKELFPEFLALPCNIIVTAHMRKVQDDTGAITFDPLVQGKDLPVMIPVWFGESYHCHTVEGTGEKKGQVEFKWGFKPDRKIAWVKSRALPSTLASPIPAGFASIKPHVQWKLAEENLLVPEDMASTQAALKAAAAGIGTATTVDDEAATRLKNATS
jgi:hypothetical protein